MVRPVWRSFPDRARPRRAALYASYGLLVGFHTLAFWKTMRRLGTVPVAVSKGTQQALPFLLSHILFATPPETTRISSVATQTFA
jgi:hypothetical protein